MTRGVESSDQVGLVVKDRGVDGRVEVGILAPEPVSGRLWSRLNASNAIQLSPSVTGRQG